MNLGNIQPTTVLFVQIYQCFTFAGHICGFLQLNLYFSHIRVLNLVSLHAILQSMTEGHPYACNTK